MKGYNPQPFLFKLFLEKEILSEFEGAIMDLFSKCSDSEEASLIEHMMRELVILSQKQVVFALKSIGAKIVEMSKHKNVAVVAACMDGTPDSSHMIVQMLKPIIGKNDNIHLYNGMIPFGKNTSNYDLCLIVDEFSGTGKTIVSRYKHLKNEAKQKRPDLQIEVMLVSAMEKAIKHISEAGVPLGVEKVLKAGLSGFYEGEELLKKIALMKKLESNLAPTFQGEPLPSLGYGEAESMYAVQSWNAPNSNFPILWWPNDAAGDYRTVLLHRGNP